MPAIVNLLSFLAEQPGFSETVTFDQLSQFIGLASSIKNDILAAQPPTHDPNDPPLLLAPHQRVFLTQTCNIPLEFIDHCWLAVRAMVWRKTFLLLSSYTYCLLIISSLTAGQTLWPPTQQCTNTNCPSTQLLRERDGLFPVTLFTLRNGARATYSTYLTCCGTQYHPNYLVRYGRRLYYEEVPAAIEVARHIYVERELAELFVGQMLISWTSATNAAQLYNVVLAANSSTKQPPTSNLSTDHVWDAFTILTLLEDFARQGRVLDVPHGCVQANRFFEAMAYRTSRIADIGHEMDRHYCDKCMRVFQEENGELSKIHALVVDGICIGRPCCAYQLEPCKNPLMSKHARFCAVHAPESLVCAVVTCRSAVDEGYLTCSEPAHRQLESNRRERQKAMFYLSQVHHRHGISHPANSLEPDDLADDIELPDGPEAPQQSTTFTAQDQCPDKEDESARKLRGVFGRNRTHAEVVFHRPCGIMIRRETCYKAETLTQITVSASYYFFFFFLVSWLH
ncbi:hypothetical protein BDP27DRAFT_1208981 [Rhodocollybia butyracea]|uniref:CxC5 like cysteine cluster associated with KDZ domain-containing protein n=1 Tax=Rhodocollybia butyracea TaxID=206335 RepID=A0A9P5UFB8_9AGAR|nr:hypothetical protein BDP27DRAFT_1208981 [Rhodocollybia butyracea]